MTKIKFLIMLLIVFLISSGEINAHPGHVHPDTYLQQVKEQKGSTYRVTINGEDAGNFAIRSVIVTSLGAKLKIKQFSGKDSEEFKTVSGIVTDDKILNYAFTSGANKYIVIVDFQNLEEGDNSGMRIIYSTDSNSRELFNEEIVVSKLAD